MSLTTSSETLVKHQKLWETRDRGAPDSLLSPLDWLESTSVFFLQFTRKLHLGLGEVLRHVPC